MAFCFNRQNTTLLLTQKSICNPIGLAKNNIGGICSLLFECWVLMWINSAESLPYHLFNSSRTFQHIIMKIINNIHHEQPQSFFNHIYKL